MAKINDTTTYPITTPTLDDLLIGTNTTDGKTKNFEVDGLLGLAVPTGGTVGQVLAKASGTDFATHWVDPSGGSSITLKEVDGSPSLTLSTLRVPNGTLTDDGGGQGTLAGLALTGSTNVFTAHNAFGAGATIDQVDTFGDPWSSILNLTDSGVSGEITDLSTPGHVFGLRSVISSITNFNPVGAIDQGITGIDIEAHLKGSANYGDAVTITGGLLYEGNGTAHTLNALDAEVAVKGGGTAFRAHGGIFGSSVLNANSAATHAIGALIYASIFSSGHATTAEAIYASLEIDGGGTADNAYGLHVANEGIDGITGTLAGVLVDSLIGGGGSVYAIKTNGGETRHLTGAAGTVGLSIQADASQSADLLRLLASDGTTKLAYFDSAGDLFLPTKTANTIYAGPTSGGAARPAFRALVAADIPSLSSVYQPLDADLTTIAGLTATTDNFIVSVASAWASRTPAQVRTTLALVPGTNVQAFDATLSALAAYNTNGLLTQTAADTFTGRTITGTSNRLSVSNGDGVSGNPTLDVDSAYVGQATITTLGTIAIGTWSATAIAVNKGGTAITSYAIGDLLYADGSASLAKLADVATGNALISGGITTAPSWGKVGLTTHISGTLPVANGGTNATTAAAALTNLGAQTEVAESRVVLSGATNYSLPGCVPISISALPLSANFVTYGPVFVRRTITVDQLATEITTAVASGKVRIGLYNADINWQPTTLIVDSGDLDASTTGVKTASISQVLLPGRYLTAMVNNSSTIAQRFVRAGSEFYGYVSALGASAFASRLVAAFTYAALPSTATAPTTQNTASSAGVEQYVFLRVSTP